MHFWRFAAWVLSSPSLKSAPCAISLIVNQFIIVEIKGIAVAYANAFVAVGRVKL